MRLRSLREDDDQVRDPGVVVALHGVGDSGYVADDKGVGGVGEPGRGTPAASAVAEGEGASGPASPNP